MDSIQMRGVSPRGGATIGEAKPLLDLSPAAPHSDCDDQRTNVIQTRFVVAGQGGDSLATPYPEIPSNGGGEGGQSRCGTHAGSAALAATINEIREQWRRRQAWHRAEKSLTLQAKALCRRLAQGGDKKEADVIYSAALGKGSHPMADIALAAMFPLTEARSGIERHRKAVERRLTHLAKALPVAPWVEGVRGVGLLSLAAIVGEAGDLSNYANPAKLWKRMGLAVMPDGHQRRTSGIAALEHGYSPARRSVVWNIGACIVKAGGPLKQVYDARKAYELPRVGTRAHAHNRAQRYVEKRFLRDLWAQWRRAGGGQCSAAAQASCVSPATHSNTA